MGDISKQTAHRIWLAHREIESAQKMLADITERRDTPTPECPFGDTRYELGVPSGTGYRLFAVGNALAASVIAEHIHDMERELKAASAEAHRELVDGAAL